MSSVAKAISTTRGVLRHVEASRVWSAEVPEASTLLNLNLVYFNGAFSPPTRAHAYIISTIAAHPGVDALWLDPEPSRPKKPMWLNETFEARIDMCERMMVDMGLAEKVGVGTLRHDLGPELGSTLELFRTLRSVLGGVGHGRLMWALGADVLDGMRWWAEKARTFLDPGSTCDGLFVFVRKGWSEEQLREAAAAVFGRELASDELIILPMPESLADASSHNARKHLVKSSLAGSSVPEDCPLLLPVIHNVCMAQPDLLDVFKDQVANTPDLTPEARRSSEPDSPTFPPIGEPLLPLD